MKYIFTAALAFGFTACTTTEVRKVAMDTPDAVIDAPVKALNLKKKDIPGFLQDVENPYKTVKGLSCGQLRSEINDITDFAGPDWDSDEHYTKQGRSASELVDAVMPYGGIMRFISGASAHEKDLARALNYAIVRRAYLKAHGQQRRCAWPAAPKI